MRNRRKLTLTIKTFRSMSSEHRTLLGEEAEHVARLRGASTVQVEFADAAR